MRMEEMVVMSIVQRRDDVDDDAERWEVVEEKDEKKHGAVQRVKPISCISAQNVNNVDCNTKDHQYATFANVLRHIPVVQTSRDRSFDLSGWNGPGAWELDRAGISVSIGGAGV
ncbi:hypothetical protein TWF481_000503 [Arthrobotrys musiformis]|uniref:Uncharacterized protein n=1 Tax=Arthrobotrys musiformis TaxID=47236 RepID=A0AAV9WPK8_9PEZI